MFGDFYHGKRVFITGHTGFKGSWLAEWLLALGAEVHGFALAPQPDQPLFDELDIGGRIFSDTRGDLRNPQDVSQALAKCRPQVIFHLAAQPLVRLSYDIPVETFAVNVMGTTHLLDTVRRQSAPCSVVCITTDKCYENREWLHAYREEDAMGGHDPYSASKGAAELVISSYRSSFFPTDGPIRLASARAGNVIGGGDWALDRIVPDCIRALRGGKPVPVRNKTATRPWQHLLEPLSGYLWLGSQLHLRPDLCSAFNFGPSLASNRTVAELVAGIIKYTGGSWIDQSDPNAPHEAGKLNLATDKAFHMLQWQPVWNFDETIEKTADWYMRQEKGDDAHSLTTSQISSYVTHATEKSILWAAPTPV